MKTENKTQCIMIEIAGDEILYRDADERYCVVREGDWVLLDVDSLLNPQESYKRYGSEWFQLNAIKNNEGEVTICASGSCEPDDVDEITRKVTESNIIYSRDGYTYQKLEDFQRLDRMVNKMREILS